MIYSLLRAIAGVALRWYYADVTITDTAPAGAALRASLQGPLLVVVNHPNALVDVLVAARAVPRRLMFTAKATLFSNPIARVLLSWVGVVPLRRTSDEGGAADPSRNAQVFDAITQTLAKGRAVLIFPEGKSHDEPAMAPLRTGTARLALHGRDSGTVHGLRILPIGLVFERKDAPRTRILALIGEPLDVDSWKPKTPAAAVGELTSEIDARLRAVTLNYATIDAAASDGRLARQIAAIVRYEPPSVGASGDLRDRTTVAQLLPVIRAAMSDGRSDVAQGAAAIERDLASLQASLDAHGIALDDLAISHGIKEGAVFVVRELAILLTAGPVAIWGWLNHVIPFRAAFAIGRRVRDSAADPAMRTIVAGTAFVLMVYMLQGAVVALIAGPWWAMAYVASLPIATDINLRFRERLERARRRAKTYLLFRARPELQKQLEGSAKTLRAAVVDLARATGAAEIT